MKAVDAANVVVKLNQDIHYQAYQGNGASHSQKAHYAFELNKEIIRAHDLCGGKEIRRDADTAERLEEMLRDLRHFNDVLEQKD